MIILFEYFLLLFLFILLLIPIYFLVYLLYKYLICNKRIDPIFSNNKLKDQSIDNEWRL